MPVDNGADVQLYVIEDGGHTWPGAREVRPNGGTTQSIGRHTDLMLQFFQAGAVEAVVAAASPEPASCSLGSTYFFIAGQWSASSGRGFSGPG